MNDKTDLNGRKGRIQMGGRIVVFGSYVTDLTGRGTRFPVPGETVLGASFQMGPAAKVPIRRSPLSAPAEMSRWSQNWDGMRLAAPRAIFIPRRA